MTRDSNPFITTLLNNEDIKRELVRQKVEEACLKARHISRADISNRSARFVEMNHIVEDHFVCTGLLKQLMIHNSHPDKDNCELFRTIVHDIVERIMSSRPPLPRRR